MRRFKNVKDCYKKLREEGFAIFATHLEEKAKSLFEIDMKKKLAIVVGNEHKGVSSEAAQLADGILQIPMYGMIQSLNVSVATAVILFEAVRQRIASGQYDESKYSDAELKKLIKMWVMKQ
jgi:tRNA (guanosine-2'-O-)-methyltransferase